ncbi:hypothetical protein RJT34_12085 [Clitoria ternatea]|uniref:Uncharacterized protein n=1 Tax=Clitoria ternatea TaxID=43366 RepID=A0AAN9JPQ5_CLITE
MFALLHLLLAYEMSKCIPDQGDDKESVGLIKKEISSRHVRESGIWLISWKIGLLISRDVCNAVCALYCRLILISLKQMKSSAEFKILISRYQLTGVPTQIEEDKNVKATMGLKNAEICKGYTKDVVAVRRELCCNGSNGHGCERLVSWFSYLSLLYLHDVDRF